MPYNNPIKKKDSACKQLKSEKGKLTGLMMEGSVNHMSMLHQEEEPSKRTQRIREKRKKLDDKFLDGKMSEEKYARKEARTRKKLDKSKAKDEESALEMSPYKMSPLNDNHWKIDPKTGKKVDEFGTEIPDNFDVSITDADALSSRRLDQERRINEALDLAEAVNQGDVSLNLGNIATDYPSASQYIVGTGTGPEGVIGQGGGKTKYTRTGVTNRVNELREKMNQPGGVQSVFDELSTRTRYGANRLGDAKPEWQDTVDPLGIRRDRGYTDKRTQYVQPGQTIYERMQANKNKS